MDYNSKEITSLTSLYPNDLRNDFIDSLNNTIFNRQLTNQNYTRSIGAIGNEDLSSEIRNILESNKFLQDNQLQPVLASVEDPNSYFLTWTDFLNQLRMQDVDVDNYSNWGRVTQFNWIPPIDLDKFINFRDYYWDIELNNKKVPNYITIKNRNVFRKTRTNEIIKNISSKLPDGYIIDAYDIENKSILLNGNLESVFPVGDYFILSGTDGVYYLSKVVSASYSTITKKTELVMTVLYNSVNSIQPTKLKCWKLNSIDNTFYIDGYDYTTLFIENFIFNLIETDGIQNILHTVKSDYEPQLNRTYITTNYNSDIPDYILIDPLILTSLYEQNYLDGFDILDTSDILYKILYSDRLNKLKSNNGETFSATNELKDFTVNFFEFNINVDDNIKITKESGHQIEGNISFVDQNVIEFNSKDIQYVFNNTNLSYEIYRSVQTENYFIEPLFPNDGTIWVDTNTDTVKQWSGSNNDWVVIIRNFDILYQKTKETKLVIPKNGWIESNSWIHKSQVVSTSGMIRAQIPIIEYDDRLFLSSTVFTEHVWSYRNLLLDDWKISNTAPTLIELVDIQLTGNNEFWFTSANTIRFSPKYGNLTESFYEGRVIDLFGFSYNSGAYIVDSSEYVSENGIDEMYTLVTLKTNIFDIHDLPLFAGVRPKFTSRGDTFSQEHIQWRYDGVGNMYPTSIMPEKNPNYFNQIGGSDNNKFGYNWESFSFASTVTDPILVFEPQLHKFCLLDDYQEGDIRVYINGARQIGNFIELPSPIDNNFVGSIKFIDNVVLTENDVVLIEVGSYYIGDAGKEAITVLTPSGFELVNLSQFRFLEQIKYKDNQEIEFIVMDILSSSEFKKSSKIFSYLENEDFPMNPYINKKLETVTNNLGSSFVFQQHLKDENKLLGYLYNTVYGAIQKTIWHPGSNGEQYVPTTGDDGEWKIPNNWYYNPHHENRTNMSYSDLFQHFNSIIRSQKESGIDNKISNIYFMDSDINLGLGGTIKEFNGNFDLLMSAIFYDFTTLEDLIYFARNQYNESLFSIKDMFIKEFSILLNSDYTSSTDLQNNVNNYIINSFEENSKLQYYFGDTTMFDGSVGMRNWILTLPMMGVCPAVYPYAIKDDKLNIHKIIHHDGHASDVYFQPNEKEKIYKEIELSGVDFIKQTVSNDTSPFPTDNAGSPLLTGTILLRTITSERIRSLYQFDGAVWKNLDITNIFVNLILEIERKLYDISQNKDIKYDFLKNISNTHYISKLKKQFEKYVAEKGIVDVYQENMHFVQNDAFSWNYSNFIPSYLPNAGINYKPFSNWKALYKNIFNTSYPHLEPWKIQGYANKPGWWDNSYLSSSGSYDEEMWDNILDGIVPNGMLLPSGVASNGTVGETLQYNYLPVVTIGNTADGYSYGDLLPPYWDSSNNLGIMSIRSLFDPNVGDEIISPNITSVFSQSGYVESAWKESINYLYDLMVVSFKLDPMQFISSTFGYDKFKVNCLKIDTHSSNIQPANNVVFNGDEYDGEIFKSSGLNQWYVNHLRYNEYDYYTTKFNKIWKKSSMKLAYLFDSMIDKNSFRIKSDYFDMVDSDRKIYSKYTKNHEIKQIDSINISLLSIPSKHLGDVDRGWTVGLSTISNLKSPINYYGVQNYNTIKTGNRFTIATDNIIDIKYSAPLEELELNYSNSLSISDQINFITGNSYTTEIIIDGLLFDISVSSENVTTVGELINYLNANIENAYFDLRYGNIVLVSEMLGTSLEITNDLIFDFINPNLVILPQQTVGTKFNNIIMIGGNRTTTYATDNKIKIVDSTHLNGDYIVSSVSYDIKNNITSLEIINDISLPSNPFVIDGRIIGDSTLPLPDEWVDGSVVYFNSGDNVKGLQLDRPYYIIRHDGYSFSIAETERQAIYRKELDLSGVFSFGSLYVGKIDRTFRTTTGNATDIVWRVHTTDTRLINSVYDGVSISGIQSVLDFLFGYISYAESVGFSIPNTHVDESGRPFSWELYVDKFIDWAFRQRFIRQGSRVEYKVQALAHNDSFNFVNSSSPNWANGTSVLLYSADGGILPPPFVDSSIIDVPYYIIKSVDNSNIRLALTPYDASIGNFVDFNQNSSGDVYMQVYEKNDNYPVFSYSPFIESIDIRHPIGLTDNMHSSPSYIYDLNGELLNSSEIYVSREDGKTNISLLGKIQDTNKKVLEGLARESKYIGGLKCSIKTFEHILIFNNYSVSKNLIYDTFIGLRTPRFLTMFNRQTNREKRPTLGGMALVNDDLQKNIESTVNDSRYYYDDVRSNVGMVHFDTLMDSVGYNGKFDYMESIGINDQSQYTFWKSMIQNKGTNVSINAFTNNKILERAELDEFWAYKVSEFGGVEQTEYPEMKLFTDECSSNELRIEFVRPDNVKWSSNFIPVRMNDMNRWWKQPDQADIMLPYDSFFITTKPLFIMNPQNISENTKIGSDGNSYVRLFNNVEFVDVFYTDNGIRKDLIKNVDYVMYNNEILAFDYTRVTPFMLDSTTIIGLTYNDVQEGPSKIIDKKSGVVLANVPFWNPAIKQYDPIFYSTIDIVNSVDPANYESPQNNNEWYKKAVDTIWLDDTRIGYVPYYDTSIMPNLDDRIFNWGKMADWAEFNVYQWTESELHPKDWNTSNEGEPLFVVEVNFGDDYWMEEREMHTDIIAGTLNIETAPELYGECEIYVNGEFKFFREINSAYDYFTLSNEFNKGSYIHLIRRAHVPTEEELNNGNYRIVYKHNRYDYTDPVSGNKVSKYYFWVKNKTNTIYKKQRTYTLKGISKGLEKCSSPYMIVQNVRYNNDAGYGLVYGNVFDRFNFGDLPYRYTQLIVKGLEGKIKDNDRYVLRFIKDFNLRDKLRKNSLKEKNVFEDWKLFREKQFTKIDRLLWNKVISAMIGYPMITDYIANTNIPIPAMNRVVYDRLFNSDTRYGLDIDQVLLEKEEIKAIISNELSEFYVNTIDSFKEIINELTFDFTLDTIDSMNTIYSLLPTEFINKLFFAVLFVAMTKKKEYPNLFKTSWVAFQITQDIKPIPEFCINDDYELVPGTECATDDIIFTPTPVVPTPTPTPSVSPSAPVTPTPTPTATPSPTPLPNCYGEFNRIIENGAARAIETDDCRELE